VKGAIFIALVLGAWSWFGVWLGAVDISSGVKVAVLIAVNVVAGWFLHDTFFNNKED
jgi:hypothetical protein